MIYAGDVVVIGGGMAGVSVAAALAPQLRVVLLEMESQLAYHTTGRSAALYSQTYGPASVRALTRASAAFFDRPPAGFSDQPLLAERGALFIARADQQTALDALIAEIPGRSPIQRLDAVQTHRLVPMLKKGYASAGSLLEPGARDIDVHAMHQGYLRTLRRAGGEVLTRSEVLGIERDGQAWAITTKPLGNRHPGEGHPGEGRLGQALTIRAPMIVNAAGAWADHIGRLAGAKPIGLVPKRRTAITVAIPPGIDPRHWPAVIDAEEQFYLKPESGRLLLSPADETPSEPCDAQPEELDIAVCVDRIQRAFDLPIARIESRWAGLRCFVADKSPVCGLDADVPGFLWLAGQGGYGIQSAPALARVAAALALGQAVPPDIVEQGLDAAELAPTRAGLR